MSILLSYLPSSLAFDEGFASMAEAAVGFWNWKPTAMVVAAFFALAGGVMVKRGWWPKRVGDTGFCKRCRYNLTGSASATCPECGAALDVSTTIIGERRRRPVQAVLGLFLLLLVAAGIVLANVRDIRQINFYRYRPTAWVISDIASPTAQTARRAWAEIDRRQSKGPLAERRLGQLTQVSFKLHVQSKSQTFNSARAFDFLAERLIVGMLSAEQRDVLAQNIVRLELHVRPRVLPGDPAPFSVRLKGNLPCGQTKLEHSSFEVHVDDVQFWSSPSAGSGCGSFGFHSGGSFDATPEGQHVATMRYRSKLVEASTGATLLDIDQTREAQFEVTDDPSASIQLIRSDDLDKSIRENIVPEHVFFVRTRKGDRIDGRLRFDHLPVPVAFDVYARLAEREVKLQSTRRSTAGTVSISGNYDGPPVDHMDIILEPSIAAARNSIDIYEIWDGQVELRDVPVIHSSSPPDVVRQLFSMRGCLIEGRGATSRMLALTYVLQRTRIDLAFDVFIRADDVEYSIGQMIKSRNSHSEPYHVRGRYDGPLIDQVDLVFRSLKLGEIAQPRITDPWQGEIVFEGVPVNLP